MSYLDDLVFNWLRARKRKKDLKTKIKTLQTTLNNSDAVTQAMILAMAAVFKKRVIDNSAQLSKALNYPHKMSKERLGLIFELLQAIQSKMIQEKQGLDKKLDYMNIQDQSRIPHWDKSVLGMDLWMVTIGSAYYPKIQPAAVKIWKTLDVASEKNPEAINKLRQLDHSVQDISESDKSMFGNMNDAQWLEECQFRPEYMAP
jgi:hypothetical protein